jgi:hypothetical protein
VATRKERVILDLDPSPYLGGLGRASAGTAAFVRQLDTGNDRASMLTQSLLAVGPATVPIAGLAVPAVAGLSTQLGFAAAGAGVMVLAFKGVGDALEAVNKYQLEPSAENFAALQEKMQGLGPEAERFVLYLDDIMPRLQSLREEAQAEGLTGVMDGIDAMLTRLPQVRRIIGEIAGASGDLAAETGQALASDDWDEFFNFLEVEARPNLMAFGHTVGNVLEGIANTWMALNPVSDDFTEGLLDWSRNFASATEDLDENEKFQALIDYVRDNGPEAVDALAAVGGAFVSLVEAAAPVGSASLPIIEAVAKTLSAIAESPAGPHLIAAAAGISAISRAIGLYNAANGSALLGMMRGTSSEGRKAGGGAEAAASGLGLLNERVSRLKALGRGAGLVAGLSLAFTDVDEKIGLSNTAMLGMMGTMAGPWGAAAGATVGYLMDIKSAGDDVEDSVDNWNQALSDNATNFDAHAGILAKARGDVNALARDLENPTFGSKLGAYFDPDEIANGLRALTHGGESGIEYLQDQYRKTAEEAGNLEQAIFALGRAYGTRTSESIFGGVDDEAALRVLERAGPAMDALGISFEDLAHMDNSELQQTVQALATWTKNADTAEGRTQAFADSVAEMADESLSAADSATQLGTALEALLAPELDAEEATDAWRASLKELQKELKDKAGFEGFSEAAMKNRELTRDYANTSIDRLTKLAAVGTTTEKDMARAVAATRREFIESGIAAGFSRKEITRRANALGLTPKLVRTVFEAAGIDEVDLRARRVREIFQGMPKRVRTEIRSEGIPETTAQVNALVKKYDLTEKQRKALITLKDLASKDIGNILDKLHIVDNTNPSPAITVRSNAAEIAAQTAAILNGLSDEIVYIHTVRTGRGGQGAGYDGAADGWTVPDDGGGYRDYLYVKVAPGEEIITNRHGEADQFRADRSAGRIPAYADGGTIARHQPVATRAISGGHSVVERVVERLPRQLVIDAGALGRMVIDTVDGRIDAADLLNAEAGRAL